MKRERMTRRELIKRSVGASIVAMIAGFARGNTVPKTGGPPKRIYPEDAVGRGEYWGYQGREVTIFVEHPFYNEITGKSDSSGAAIIGDTVSDIAQVLTARAGGLKPKGERTGGAA